MEYSRLLQEIIFNLTVILGLNLARSLFVKYVNTPTLEATYAYVNRSVVVG